MWLVVRSIPPHPAAEVEDLSLNRTQKRQREWYVLCPHSALCNVDYCGNLCLRTGLETAQVAIEVHKPSQLLIFGVLGCFDVSVGRCCTRFGGKLRID